MKLKAYLNTKPVAIKPITDKSKDLIDKIKHMTSVKDSVVRAHNTYQALSYREAVDCQKIMDKMIDESMGLLSGLIIEGYHPTCEQLKGMNKQQKQHLDGVARSTVTDLEMIDKICKKHNLVFVPKKYTWDTDKFSSRPIDDDDYVLCTLTSLRIREIMKNSGMVVVLGDFEMVYHALTISLPILNNVTGSAQINTLNELQDKLLVLSKSKPLTYASFQLVSNKKIVLKSIYEDLEFVDCKKKETKQLDVGIWKYKGISIETRLVDGKAQYTYSGTKKVFTSKEDIRTTITKEINNKK